VKVAKRAEIERAVDRPDPAIRFYLFYGPDEAGSRALADRLGKALGADIERIDFDGSQLARDPALLADEAASQSLFGGARWIRVRANGDEVASAAEALLDAPQAGNPVAIIAGALKPTGKLLKLALAAPGVLAFASYAPEGQEADRVAIAIGHELGVRLQPDVARRLAEAAGGDRAVIARELEKIADYLDADRAGPKEADFDTLAAIGAGQAEADQGALVDAALLGNTQDAAAELVALSPEGSESIPLVRAALRRALQLAQLRADAEAKGSIDAALAAAGKSLFWKEKNIVEAELRRWSPAELARLVDRLTDAQAKLVSPANAGAVLAADEFLAIARAVARRR
jgi:DNA polymerase-3 subunit delta